MRILLGIFLFGLSFIIDAISQVADCWRRGYEEKLHWQMIWDAVLTFSFGFIIIAGIVYFLLVLLGHRT